ncbi:MAG: flagellar FliJ family protein [Desulfonauticus sp.]|nr:flagellar FliJ family protein [Desulfonauticus sp.]
MLEKLKQDYQAEVQREKDICQQIVLAKQKIFSQPRLDGSILFIHQNHLKGLEKDLKICQNRQQILSQEITLWRQEVVKRSKDKKILEKLKQKQKEAFIYEQRQKEQKELDEVATLRFGRTCQDQVEDSF